MKGTRALILSGVLLTTLLLCLAVPADPTGNADGGGGGDVSAETITTADGYTINTDQLQETELYTSTTIDKIKDLISVTDPDGQPVTDFVVATGETTLHAGSNTVHVYVNGISIASFSVNVTAVAIESMTAVLADGFEIYSSYDTMTELIKEHLTVTATFNDGIKRELGGSEYTITGAFTPGVENTFTVTYNDDPTKSCTFAAYVNEQVYESLRVEVNQTSSIESSTSMSMLKLTTSEEFGDHSVTVKVFGKYTDGREEQLDYTQYDFTGSLNVNKGTPNGDGTYTVTVTVVDSATGLLSETFQLRVTASVPTSLTYTGEIIGYMVGDRYVVNAENFTVSFQGGGLRNPIQSELNVSFPEGSVDDEGCFTTTGLKTLTVSYTEGVDEDGNPITVSCKVNVTVSAALVDRPSFDSTPATYDDGQEFDRTMTGYDESIMDLAVTRDGEALTNGDGYRYTISEDGTLIFHASDAGVYTITVVLDDNHRWSTSAGTNPVWTWTIYKASIDAVLEIDGWEYDGGLQTHDYAIHQRGDESIVYTDFSIVYYYGESNDGTVDLARGQAVTQQPTLAGSWHAYAVVTESDNYYGDTTDDVDFTIDRQDVVPISIADITYDSSEHDVSGSFENYTISATPQTVVGDYTATVTMTDDYYHNHEWSNTHSSVTTVEWSIVKATVPIPTIAGGPWTYTTDAEGNAIEYTVSLENEFEGLVIMRCAQVDVTIDGITATSSQAGVYSLSVSLSDSDNYRWEGTGDDISIKTITWTIGKAEVSKPTLITDQPKYTGNIIQYTEAIEVPEPSLVTVSGQTSGTDAASYTVTIELEDADNYKWAETDDSSQFTLTWSIVQASNSISNVTVDTDPSLTYNGFGLDVFSATAEFGQDQITYLFSTEQDGDYTEMQLPLGAGDWYVKAHVDATSNYAEAISAEGTHFHIDKAENTIVLTPYADNTVTYGESYEAPVIDSADYGSSLVFQYSDSVDGVYTEGLPTDAGLWYIRAHVPESDNYLEGHSDPVGINIERFAIPYPTFSYTGESVAEDGQSFIYNGTERMPSVVLAVTEYPYEDVMADAISYTLVTQTNAGTYDVTFTPGDNYRWADSSNPQGEYITGWTISKKVVVIDSFTRTMVYNGSQFTPEIPTDDSLYTISIPRAVERGEYMATLTLLHPDNYEWGINSDRRDDGTTPWDSKDDTDPAVLHVGFAITNQTYTITITVSDVTYPNVPSPDVESIVPSITGSDITQIDEALRDGQFQYYYRVQGENGNGFTTVPTGVGDYEVRIHVDATTSFDQAYSAWVPFSIGPATIEITHVQGFDETYNGTAFSVEGNATLVATVQNPEQNALDWKFSLSLDGEFTDDLPLTNVNTYTVYYTVSAPNHTTIGPDEDHYFTVTISPVTIPVNLGTGSIDYDGQTPTADDLWSVFGGTVADKGIDHLVPGDTVERLDITLSVPEDSEDVSETPYTVNGHCGNGNYTITFTPGSLTILPVDLETPNPSIAAGTGLVYNNTDYVVSDYITGLPQYTDEGDPITWTFSTSAVGSYSENLTVRNANPDGYTIYYRGSAPNHNDFVSSVQTTGQYLTLTVEKRQLTITLGGVQVEYGDVPVYGTPAVSGFAVDENQSSLHMAVTPSSGYEQWVTAAGETMTITVEVTGNLNNYTYWFGGAVLTVMEREITVIIDDKSSGYGEDLEDLTCHRDTGSTIRDGDSLSSIVSVGFENGITPTDVRAGGYRIVGTDVPNDNYDVTFVGSGDRNRGYGIYTITAASVTISFLEFTDDVYDGEEKVFGYELSVSDVPQDSVSVTYYRLVDGAPADQVDNVVDAGTYRVTVTLSGNYTGSASNDYTISPADYEEYYDISITFTDSQPTYNGQMQYPNLNLESMEDSALHGLGWSYSTGATNVSDNRVEVTVTFTLPDEISGNIRVPDLMTACVTVQPVTVDVYWDDSDFVYDGTEQTVQAWYYHVDDTEHASPVYLDTSDVRTYIGNEVAEFKDWVNGGYVITADFKFDDNLERNYALSHSDNVNAENCDRSVFIMAQRPVTVVANSYTITYGDELPVLSWHYQEGTTDAGKFVLDGGTVVQASDMTTGIAVTTSQTVEVGTPVGSVYVNASCYGMTGLSNFDVTYEQGTLTIEKRQITIDIHNQSSVYHQEIVVSSERGESADEGAYHVVSGTLPDIANHPDLDPAIVLVKAEGTDAGTYAITLGSYNQNYEVTVQDNGTYEIRPAQITGISVSHDDFDYDGSTHDGTEFETSAVTVDGSAYTFTFSFTGENYVAGESLTFSDAGDYTVYYQVSAPNHGTVDDSFTFSIGTAQINISYTEVDDWIYSGEPPNVSGTFEFGDAEVSIYRGNSTSAENLVEGGFTTSTDADTYTVLLYVPESISSWDHNTPNYGYTEASYLVIIDPLEVSVEWVYPSFVYDGYSKTNTITIEDYMEFGTGGDHDHSPEPVTTTSGKTMTMIIATAGTYQVWVELTNDNYCWDRDNPGERWFPAVWFISEGDNGWVNGLTSFGGWVYDGGYDEPQGVTAEHGTVYFMYSATEDGTYTRAPFTDAGTYYIVAVVDATESYGGLRSEPVEYTIEKCPVDIVEATGDTEFTYDGSVHTVAVSEYDPKKVSVTGTSATNAGNYTVTVSLVDGRNYVWNDGTGSSEDYTIPWAINKVILTLPTYSSDHIGDDGVGFLEYNLHEQTYPFVFDPVLVEVTGDTGAAAKTYTAEFEIVDATNYAWPEGTQATDGAYALEWRIDPMTLTVPTLDFDTTVYDPNGTYNTVTNYVAAYMGLSTNSVYVSVSIVGDEVTLTADRVSSVHESGQYWIDVSFASDNFQWNDGTQEVKRLYWTVTPVQVTLTSGNDSFLYDGEEKTYRPGGFDANTMFIDGDRRTNAGSYEAKVTLRDTLNYVWSENMSEYIGEDGSAYMPWSITAETFDLDSLAVNLEFIYDGTPHVPVFTDLPSWLTVSFEGGVTEAGTGDVTVTFATVGQPDYTLETTEKNYTVTVVQRTVTIDVADAEMTYGGDVPSIGWSYAEGSLGFVESDSVTVETGTDYKGGNRGEYNTTATTTADTGNYSVNINPGTLTVNPIVVPYPENDRVEYTGSEVDCPFTGPFTVVSGATATSLGDHTATIRLNDPMNYVWWDGTNGDKTLTWRIVAGDQLMEDYFDVDTSDEVYTGSEIERSVVSLNPNIRQGEDYAVTYSDNVDAGTATITITGIGDFEDSVLTYEFTIYPRPVSVPELVSLEYQEGVEQSAPYSSNEYYTVSGEVSGTEVGDYTVTFTLNNTESRNYVWSDGTYDQKTVTWRIVSEHVLIDGFFVVDTTDETYTGSEIEKSVICVNPDMALGTDYTVSYSNNVDASTTGNPARITITGLGDYEGSVLEYTFWIDRLVPVLEFVGDGFRSFEDEGTFSLTPYMSGIGADDIVWTSSDPSVAEVDPETGVVTIRSVGTAEITATFPGDGNREAAEDSYTLNVDEVRTEIVVVPGGSGGAGGDSEVIYVPTVIRQTVDGGISDLTWLLIIACIVVVMLAVIWLIWTRRDGE